MRRRDTRTSGSSVPISLEERYGSLFENAGEGIFQTFISGRILDVNPALARSFGYRSPEEMKKDIRNVSRQIYTDRHLLPASRGGSTATCASWTRSARFTARNRASSPFAWRGSPTW